MSNVLKLVDKPELTSRDILKNRMASLEKSLMLDTDEYFDDLLDLIIRYFEEFDLDHDQQLCYYTLIVAWSHLQKENAR